MLVRIGLLAEGGYPYAIGEAGLWCERLVHGLGQHQFDLYALGSTGTHRPLPPNARIVRTGDLDTLDDIVPEKDRKSVV